MPVRKYYCNDIITSDSIGQGAFGTVYEGSLSLNRKAVAVKINSGEDWETWREVNRMKRLDHANVMTLMGVVPTDYHGRNCNCEGRGLDDTTTWIIMEYMPMGNLLEYVSDYAGGVPASGMIKIAHQVAQGMWYLHKHANVVHMDLAARNVLVKDDDFTVKIADFGLLCDYDYSEHYYQDNNGNGCPLRWMPPENLPTNGDDPSYTRKGDVWSFGVLLFEIWSRGKLPFEDYSHEEVMDFVSAGETVLDYFDLCARSWVMDLMNECFEYDKSDRPNFRYIVETIEESSGCNQ